MADDTPTTTHEQFNASDSDITIQSADGVLFLLHRKNLEVSTGAFPGSEFNTDGEHVHLTEPAVILEILFQFLYPKRHPNLKNLEFDILAQVAEAAEKYEIFSAMNTCEDRLRDSLPAHPTEIFAHAVKHDYPDLIDKASVLLARFKSINRAQILRVLPTCAVISMVEYHAAWDTMFEDAIRYLQTLLHGGNCHGQYPSVCSNCRHCLVMWVTYLQGIDNIPELEMAIKNPTLNKFEPNHRRCQTCVGDQCHSLPGLLRVINERMQAITPFAKFFNPNTPAVASGGV